MSFRNWITRKASETAEVMVTQTKEVIQKKTISHMATKSNVIVMLGRIGILGLMVWLTGKSTSDIAKDANPGTRPQIPNITINNYVNDNGKESHL